MPYAALCAAAAVAYANCFSGVLLFDDRLMLDAHRASRAARSPMTWLVDFGGDDSPAAGRPVTALSFLANLAWSPPPEAGAPAPVSYRAPNVVAHAAAALALYGLLRRAFRRIPLERTIAAWSAFGVALAWVVHPIHTSAVTYVSQRAEVLMGLFVLLSLYAFERSVDGRRSAAWRVASVVSCLLALASKEVGALTPLLVLLYDRSLVSGTFRNAWASRRGFYAALFATWIVTIALLATDPRPATATWHHDGLNPANYLLTQTRILFHYVRVVVWPWPIWFDHGWPVFPVTTPMDWWSELRRYGPSLVACLAAGAVTAVLLVRRPKWGLLPALWFLVLAPSSSILPVHTEIAALHRLYLPSAILLAGVAVAMIAILRRVDLHGRAGTMAGVVGACIAMSWVVSLVRETRVQNALYHSELAFWERNRALTPDNPRVLMNLGMALDAAGRGEEALARYDEAIDASLAIRVPRAPYLARALEQAAHASRKARRWDAAIAYARRAVDAAPDQRRLRLALGAILAEAGRTDEAIEAQRDALIRMPDLAEARWNLVILLLMRGRFDEAEAEIARAPEIGDDSERARAALWKAAQKSGRWDAIVRYRPEEVSR